MVEKSPEVASTIDSSNACWRRRVCDLGADFGLTHLNSWRIRLRKRFDRRSAGSIKSRHLGQNHVGANKTHFILEEARTQILLANALHW